MEWAEEADPLSRIPIRGDAVAGSWSEEGTPVQRGVSPESVEAGDRANRLFALFMNGVLGVILAMSMAVAGN